MHQLASISEINSEKKTSEFSPFFIKMHLDTIESELMIIFFFEKHRLESINKTDFLKIFLNHAANKHFFKVILL